MDIDGPLHELGAIDTTALREAILGQEDVAWHEDESRQESFYMHHQTRSIIVFNPERGPRTANNATELESPTTVQPTN